MGQPFHSVYQLLTVILLLGSLSACRQSLPGPSTLEVKSDAPAVAIPEVTVSTAQTTPPASLSSPLVVDPYGEGIELASSAFILGQSAQSSDDWQLVTSRWQRALQTLKQVSQDSPNYRIAQTKILEYQRNLTHAQQRLDQLKNPPAPIALTRPPATTPVRQPYPPSVVASDPQGTYQAAILSRRGGTPVIEVTFNGTQRFPMILDTGASHTHISRQMANQLGIVPIGQTRAATASHSDVVFDVGRVASIEVAGIRRTNVPLSIGDSVDIGLLGNDFYQDYDIVLQANTVTFQRR